MLFHQTVLEGKQLLQRIKQILENPWYVNIRTQCKMLCLLTELRRALIQSVQ